MKNSSIISALRCPCCRSEMTVSPDGKSLLCMGERRHCFDFSSKGYVNLAPNHGNGGDSREAISARTAFFDRGYYAPIAEAVTAVLEKHIGRDSKALTVDAGCGEGYYAEAVASAGLSVVGIDLSKYGAAHTAKRLKCHSDTNSLACVASLFDIPLVDGSARALMNIFAPCAEKEFSRVLGSGGILVLAAAGRDHLLGFKRALYSSAYLNNGRADKPIGMELVGQEKIRYDISLKQKTDIINLFSMTPYYWRTSESDRQKLGQLDSLETEVDVDLFVYQKK
ncbi:MAG: methyltransferase domain-containing protein [Eubacteriales bacterium]